MKFAFVLIIITALIFSVPFSNSSLKAQQKQEEEQLPEIENPAPPKKDEKKEEKKDNKKDIKNTPKIEPQDELLIDSEGQKDVPERLKYYKEKYEESYDYPFEIVWKAVKKSLEDLGCLVAQEKYSQNDKGLYKGSLKSDFCVFSLGSDTTFKVLQKYSLEVPPIRGGIWVNGRMLYKFKIEEIAENKVTLLLSGELSGREDYVTQEVHFWKSNGFFETRILHLIKKNLVIIKNGG